MGERKGMQKSLSRTARIESIDALKGIGIILVVVGHVIPRGAVWNIIYGCHMPLFIICSGLIESELLKWKRLLRLLLAYIILAGIGTVVYACVFEFGNIYYFKQSIYNILVGGFSPGHGIYPVEALWFLPCLILISILFHTIKLVRNNWAQYALVGCGVLLGINLVSARGRYPMYGNIDIALLLLPFFYGANLLKDKLYSFLNKGEQKGTWLFPLAVLYIFLTAVNGEVNIYRGIYGRNVFLYYITGVLGVFLLWQCCVIVSKWKRCAGLFGELGKHTLVVLGTHQLLLVMTKEKLCITNPIALLAFVPVILIISVGGSLALQWGKKQWEERGKKYD